MHFFLNNKCVGKQISTHNLIIEVKMYFKKFEELTFADHYIFEKVLQNKEICQELLERLLKIKIDHIEYPEIEKTISPYYETKGVRLDVYVKDSEKVFDIELQNACDEDLPLRTRFYQSMLDTDNLLKGQDYSELPSSFIIFICNFDPFNLNLPIYSFKNRCEENPEILLNDKTIKKFYNATAYKQEKDVAISAFLEYIFNQKTVDDFTSKIDSFIQNIKQQEVNKKEFQNMNLHDRDNFRRGKKEGIIEGAHEKAIETAKNLLTMNISIENIAKATGLSVDIVKTISNNNIY